MDANHKFVSSDHRAQFANATLKLLWKTHGSTHSAALFRDVETFYAYFNEYVRNVYEVVDEIPLFAWVDFCNHGGEDVGWECSDKKALKIIFKGCEDIYN